MKLVFFMFLISLLLPGTSLTNIYGGSSGLVYASDNPKYSCGMHPMIVLEEPGICPICQMDLTQMHSGAGSSSTSQIIEIDPVTSQKMGIRVAVAERRELVRSVHTVGVVDYAEPEQYAISGKTDGWIERLYINETGQTVTRGEPLLDLYSPDLVAAQEELLLAIKNLKKLSVSDFPDAINDAERMLDAARKRLRLWDISQEQIAKLEKTGKVLKALTLHAPCSGVVSRKQVRDGEYVKAGREMLEISNISKVWVYAYIYEYEISWIKVGQLAHVTFPFSSEPITGRIGTIYPYLDKRSRTIRARIDLENPGLYLKPDMYADIIIQTDPIPEVVSIPAEAVLYTGKQETVFIDLGEGKFEPRKVKVGLQDEDGFIEVKDGIAEGERVVTSAQFMLDSESKLREAMKKMMEIPVTEEQEDLDDLF